MGKIKADRNNIHSSYRIFSIDFAKENSERVRNNQEFAPVRELLRNKKDDFNGFIGRRRKYSKNENIRFGNRVLKYPTVEEWVNMHINDLQEQLTEHVLNNMQCYG